MKKNVNKNDLTAGLVSIIIPVFNAKNYLERCIESAINQSYKKIEIILINDGSTDTSGRICDEYALSDKRIKEAYIFFAIFLFTYVAGALVGMVFGYKPILALFESVSATANVGLSVGITSPTMPTTLKLVYIFQMWAGRLEFISIFVSIGFILSLFKK